MSALTFGCVPHTDDEVTRVRMVELCEWLTEAVKVPVRPHRASSPDSLALAFGTGRVDVAWVSPTLLITHAGMSEAKPIVCSVREGVALYHGVLFVEEGSRFRSVMDLRGARAAWVAKTSAAGYIVPRLSLASRGVDPRDLFLSERTFDSHGSVARAVLTGQADVGATFAVFANGDPVQRLVRAGYDDVQPSKRARILHAAGPIPSDPVVIGPKVTMSQRVALMNAFTELTARAPIATATKHVLGADAFELVRPKAFEALREDVRSGVELGLLDP